MKKVKLVIAIVTIMIAAGGALVSGAEKNEITDIAVSVDETATHPAAYRTVPSDPSTCVNFMDVDCDLFGTILCTAEINGQQKQLYDPNNCINVLYRKL